MSILMDQQSNSKQYLFAKSPEMSFAESPALSIFKNWNKGFLGGNDHLNMTKKMSNGSLIKPSP